MKSWTPILTNLEIILRAVEYCVDNHLKAFKRHPKSIKCQCIFRNSKLGMKSSKMKVMASITFNHNDMKFKVKIIRFIKRIKINESLEINDFLLRLVVNWLWNWLGNFCVTSSISLRELSELWVIPAQSRVIPEKTGLITSNSWRNDGNKHQGWWWYAILSI